jgi:hypothetical protein
LEILSKGETLRKRGRYGDFVIDLPLSYKPGEPASDFSDFWKRYDKNFQKLIAIEEIDLRVKFLEDRLEILKKVRDQTKKRFEV